MNYVIITPAKNEEETIWNVIQSVLSQSVLPNVWIIVDDCSTDNTLKIIQEYSNNIERIYVISKKINPVYNRLWYSNVVNAWIDYLHSLEISLWYLMLLDADITIDKNYCKFLLDSFYSNPKIGLVCWIIHIKENNVRVPEFSNSKDPRWWSRMYRYEALEAIDFLPLCPSPDTVSDIKLKTYWRDFLVVNKWKAYQYRNSLEKTWIIKWSFLLWKWRYMLHFNFFHILLTWLIYVFRKPYIIKWISFILWYLWWFLSGSKRFYYIEVVTYSKNFWKRLK